MRAGPAAALLAVCALPHLLRAAWPAVAMSDGFYAHAALMLARGAEPYVDFTQVAFPLAEAVLGGAVAAFGAHVRVVEAVNALVVLGVAAALLGAGRRLAGPWAGAVAAVAWSYGTWVLHFHLFERETWVALGISLALLAYFRGGPLGWRRAALVAGGLLLAFVIKITAVMPAIALCGHLALQRRWREAWRLGLLYAAGVVGATLLCWAVWGRPFLWQVYVFGFFRAGRGTVPEALLFVLSHSDPFLLAGWVALLLYGVRRLLRPAGALVCVVALDLVYATLVSPVVWDHNMIDFAPPLALLLGAGLDAALAGRRAGRRARVLHVTLASVTALVLLVLGLDVFGGRRFVNERLAAAWKPAAHGFGITGGRDRAWLAQRAAFVRAHTGRDDVIVCTEPWVAFAADRVKLVRYWDLQPVAMGVEASLQADGLVATFAKRRDAVLVGPGSPAPDPRVAGLLDPYPARLGANALVYVRPLLLAALADRSAAFVLEPLPPGILTEDDLRAAGYVREIGPGGLAGWTAPGPAAPGRGGIQPIYRR